MNDFNEAKLRGLDMNVLRAEAGYPPFNEAKLRGINMRSLRFEAESVEFRLMVEGSRSVRNRKMNDEFTEQQFAIALAVLERKENNA